MCFLPLREWKKVDLYSGNKFKNLPNALQLVPHFDSFLG